MGNKGFSQCTEVGTLPGGSQGSAGRTMWQLTVDKILMKRVQQQSLQEFDIVDEMLSEILYHQKIPYANTKTGI